MRRAGLFVVVLLVFAGAGAWIVHDRLLGDDPPEPRTYATKVNANGSARLNAGAWRVTLARGGAPSGATLKIRTHPAKAAEPISLTDRHGTAPVNITLSSGQPRRKHTRMPITLRMRFDKRGEARDGDFAWYDERDRSWRRLPTHVSRDGRTATARVDHLTLFDWVEGTSYVIDSILSTRTKSPDCPSQLYYPDWVDDVIHVENRINDPILWCAGRDRDKPQLLVAKLAVNRGYGVMVSTGAKPAWTYNSSLDRDAFGAVVSTVLSPQNEFARMVAQGGSFVPAGEQLHVGFDEGSIRAGSRPTIQVRHELSDLLIGLIYNELLAAMGADDSASATVASAVAVYQVAQCSKSIKDGVSKDSMSNAALSCLTSGARDSVDRVYWALKEKREHIIYRQVSEKKTLLIRTLKQASRFGLMKQLGEALGDGALLEKGNWTLSAYPKVRRNPKPEPVEDTAPAEPEPVDPEPESSDASSTPGAPFDSSCVVAWPTAPVRTSDAIQLTMDCKGLPDGVLFAHVRYSDPNLPIKPSTGTVHVTGTIVDVARSELGYSYLMVDADNIDMP